MNWPTMPVFAAGKLKLYAIITAIVLIVGAALCIGAYFMGKQDQKDAQASKDVAELKAAMKKATDDLNKQQITLAAAIKQNAAAQVRMSAIASRVEINLQAQGKLNNELTANLEHALRARPDLASVSVGADILCQWNRANAGADTRRNSGTDAAAAIAGCKPAGAVPGAATNKQRLNSRPATKPPGRR